MKRATMVILALLASCGLVLAQDAPPMPQDFLTGEARLGVGQKDVDSNSSKFLEYREIPNGAVGQYFRVFGQKSGLRYDLLGGNIQQRDAFYRTRIGNNTWRLDGSYVAIPHNFGFDGKTLLQNTSPGVWRISDTLQSAFQSANQAQFALRPAGLTYAFLNNLVSPSLTAVNPVDLGLDRQRGNLVFRLTPSKPVDIRISYFHEKRTGDRAASGTSFGFGNVVELPEALQYITQDVGADAQYEGKWGVVRAGLHYNWFDNKIHSFSFDNPFRFTDATDPSAYTAPASGSIGGPNFGRMALPPDNSALRGTFGTTLRLPSRTRISADVSIGSWKQDKTPFIPYTTNTAVRIPGSTALPTDVASLPAQKLDGKADVTSLSAMLSSRPADHVSVTARFRRYDMDNKTGRISEPGYVRFDGVWEDIPRISVPYGYTTDRFDATVGYDFGILTLEGGYKHMKYDRTFRETETTSENGVVVNADLKPVDWALVRGVYEHGTRGFSGLEIERSEDASLQAAGAPANLLAVPSDTRQTSGAPLCAAGTVCNLRFDQSHRKFDRFGGQVQLSPGGKATIALGYYNTKYDYDQTTYGLNQTQYDTFSADVDYAPSDKWSVYAFYAYEKNRDDLRGRQSAATVSINAADDWTSNVKDRINSFGAGAHLTLVPEKWFLDVSGQYQKVDGNNDLGVFPGGGPFTSRVALGGVRSLPIYDDTKITTLNTTVRYRFAKSWDAGVAGYYEEYKIADSNTQNVPYYAPGSFFLSANDANYQAKWAYVFLTYRW